jgi:hypothetical protein
MAFFIFVLLYMASLYDVSDILRFLKTIPIALLGCGVLKTEPISTW